MIHIVLCDDQEYVIEGLRIVLNTEPHLSVVAIALNGPEAVAAVRDHQPDVVLLDMILENGTGINIMKRIHNQIDPAIPVIMLTSHNSDRYLFEAIRSGASGYLLKNAPRHEIIQGIQAVADGYNYTSPSIISQLFDYVKMNSPTTIQDSALQQLSTRERQVLRLIGLHLSNEEIAVGLSLSKGTIQNYVSSMMHKLRVQHRSEAARFAIQTGLVNLEE